MAIEFQPARLPERSHWKLFVFVVLLMGSLTTAAIVLAMMANSRDGVPASLPDSVSQVSLLSPINVV